MQCIGSREIQGFSLSYALHKEKRESEYMVAPKTFIGYDEEGKQICTCTAIDANEYINPEEVQAAIDNVISVTSEEMSKVSSALQKVAPDADSAIIVQGAKMTQAIEETCTAVTGLPTSFGDSISNMYTIALAEHDRLQQEENDEARNTAQSTPGVVRVGE